MKYYVLLMAVAVMVAQTVRADERPPIEYDCVIVNQTSDGGKIKFHAHQKVTLTEQKRITVYEEAGLAYDIEAYSLQGTNYGTIDLSIHETKAKLPKGLRVSSSHGFMNEAPIGMTVYGRNTLVMSCSRIP